MFYLSTSTRPPLFINPDFDFTFDFDAIESMHIPKGYELIEKGDHKKKRLEDEKKALTSRKENLLKLLDDVNEKFKEIEKELK